MANDQSGSSQRLAPQGTNTARNEVVRFASFFVYQLNLPVSVPHRTRTLGPACRSPMVGCQGAVDYHPMYCVRPFVERGPIGREMQGTMIHREPTSRASGTSEPLGARMFAKRGPSSKSGRTQYLSPHTYTPRQTESSCESFPRPLARPIRLCPLQEQRFNPPPLRRSAAPSYPQVRSPTPFLAIVVSLTVSAQCWINTYSSDSPSPIGHLVGLQPLIAVD